MHSTYPPTSYPVELGRDVQKVKEEEEIVVSTETNEKKRTMPTVIIRSIHSFATLFLKLLFRVMKVILLYLTSV